MLKKFGTKSLRTYWRTVNIAEVLSLTPVDPSQSITHPCALLREISDLCSSQGVMLMGEGRHRHGVCMISTVCAILQGRFALIEGRTEDVEEIESLYSRVKQQLFGQTLNTAKASLCPSMIQRSELLVTSENEAFCVLV